MSSAHLDVLSFQTTLANGPGTIYPSLLHDDTNALLIDTGLPGLAGEIAAAMEALGVPLARLTHIVLTHADMDHVGSLSQLLALCPQGVQVLCHEREKPYVQCDVPPLRLAQLEASLDKLTGAMKEQMTALAQNLRANYKNLRAEVTKTVEDCEMLPCGAQVVETPGHTPGHICLYLKESKTLIAGDALNVEGWALLPAPDRLAYDLSFQKASLKKLAGLDIEKVVCFHGGEYSQNVNQRMKEIAGM
jgi:glyoxylase-like metal-dependent hydrolase (beta-lactamase superfamily II)